MVLQTSGTALELHRFVFCVLRADVRLSAACARVVVNEIVCYWVPDSDRMGHLGT